MNIKLSRSFNFFWNKTITKYVSRGFYSFVRKVRFMHSPNRLLSSYFEKECWNFCFSFSLRFTTRFLCFQCLYQSCLQYFISEIFSLSLFSVSWKHEVYGSLLAIFFRGPAGLLICRTKWSFSHVVIMSVKKIKISCNRSQIIVRKFDIWWKKEIFCW